jgi:hypothetical protein
MLGIEERITGLLAETSMRLQLLLPSGWFRLSRHPKELHMRKGRRICP